MSVVQFAQHRRWSDGQPRKWPTRLGASPKPVAPVKPDILEIQFGAFSTKTLGLMKSDLGLAARQNMRSRAVGSKSIAVALLRALNAIDRELMGRR
jgi:hypothetical protein